MFCAFDSFYKVTISLRSRGLENTLRCVCVLLVCVLLAFPSPQTCFLFSACANFGFHWDHSRSFYSPCFLLDHVAFSSAYSTLSRPSHRPLCRRWHTVRSSRFPGLKWLASVTQVYLNASTCHKFLSLGDLRQAPVV